MNNTENLTSKQWEKLWWKEFNIKCLRCINKCKQSSKIILFSCKKFKEGN